MSKKEELNQALRDIETAVLKVRDEKGLYRVIVDRLARIPHFHWSGIYLLKGDTLELEYFTGRPTEHKRIPVGKGICGSAVARGKNIIVDDVSKESNYLACSIYTRSEIVVLIRDGDRILGEIDIDSDDASAFDHEDESFLERVGEILVERLRGMQNEHPSRR